ncbi:Panacea domain-containing protein [Halobacillus sp. Marseille-P3879]|uniref:Panacea domain-containing protein n=1 Tax=Halobacillus sp. Marseille-P3879 TaxID=2045014 RepID=UPI000C7AC927|nr:Panacea domain-containing protein [Halobacillus sp. Marseille-P3879]
MSTKAIDVAKWFIKNNLDSPRNTFDGNMKLQKLLYFSQLIHVAKYGKLLFAEEMRAYENGTVINDVRLTYRDSLYGLIEQSENMLVFENEEVTHTLELTASIFGEMSAKELSDLNHELSSWQIPYRESKTEQPHIYKTARSIIRPMDGIFMGDVKKVKQMLEAYDDYDTSKVSEVVNGVTFYYDPDEITLNEELLSMLENLGCPDEAYTLTFDEQQGVIIS